MKNCINCGELIHPKRLEILPNTNRCVSCSTAKPKGGVVIMRGEGDHTYTETVIMEHDDYVKYQQMEAVFNGVPFEDVNEEEEVVVKEEFEEVPIEGEIKDLSNYFKLEEEE
tara:strand:+ start:1700 stop:2035 length:336 start_codon:yes stop_codon:yes gene_type:complete